MTEAFYFDDTQEFFKHNKNVIHKNYFVFYTGLVTMASPEVESIYQLYNITDDDGSHAYCLWYSGNYIIHSFKWNDRIINALSQTIDFNEISKTTFSGNKELLLDLFKKNNKQLVILKERLIYDCTRVTILPEYNGQIEKATIQDKGELSRMSYQYQLDEFGKYARRDLEYMTSIVGTGIESGNIYKLTDNKEICSMAQVMSEDHIAPLIGQLYTKTDLRNKGYATSILSQLTIKLLSEGHERCGLLSDVSNLSSNKVFHKVGYRSVYNQLAVWFD
jgi:predicted GNAT family acetyltransferase